jgi:[protein-PII] uridylyltransferase
MPSDAYIREFAHTLSSAYRSTYDAQAIAEHARVASLRNTDAASVGLFDLRGDAEHGLCVVAQDRPGLLATISASLLASGLDVVDADAHTRRTPAGQSEAVDVFWVRRSDPTDRDRPLDDADIELVQATLIELLRGERSLETPRGLARPTATHAVTLVRFLEGDDGALSTLEVETDDRSGLLLALSRALYEQRVQIVESKVRTLDDHVIDRFRIVELDGSAIGPARRLEIQVAVIAALEPAGEPS